MIIDRIYQWACSQPAKPAIICNGVEISYRALFSAIQALRRALEREGLEPGTTAIIVSGDPVKSWLLVLALGNIGLNTICVPSVAHAKTLNLANVSCVVVTRSDVKSLDLPTGGFPGVKMIIVPSDAFRNSEQESQSAVSPDKSGHVGHIIYTSGTTGTNKKVFVDFDVARRLDQLGARGEWINKDTVFFGGDLGLWTAIGFRAPLAVWYFGGSVVFDFEPNKFERAFRHSVNLIMLTPQMVKQLLKSTEPSDKAFYDGELFVTSGFLPLASANQLFKRVTRQIRIGYGSSELGTYALISQTTSTADLYWLSRREFYTVQIVDELGNEAPKGELRIKLTDLDCSGYLDGTTASSKFFRGGWFYPGDLAVQRPDGNIRILGRVDDVLNVQGNKISAAPIEQDLQYKLEVEEVCLFSGLSAAGADQLVVAILANTQLSKSALDEIAQLFPSFSQVRFVTFEEFPRTATGKTRRAQLRNLAFGDSMTSRVQNNA